MNSKIYRIDGTKELTNMPHPALAKDLLERLVATTAKVVTNRKWSVKILKEFYPKNPSLLGLNVNAGSSIMIRLREARDMKVFLPWQSILGTMIHELTHNEIGEHSAEFYTLMDKVYDEVEASIVSSFSSSSSSFQVYNDKGIGNNNNNDYNNTSSSNYTFDGKYFKAKTSATNSNSTINGLSLKEQIAIATISRFDEAEKKKKKITKDMISLSKYRKLDYSNNRIISADSFDFEQFATINNRNIDRLIDDTKGCSLSDWQSIDELHNQIIDEWICMICNLNNTINYHKKTDDNIDITILCNWCGCPFGSTPIEASVKQLAGSIGIAGGSSSSSSSGSSSTSGSSSSSSSSSSNYNLNNNSSSSSSSSSSDGKENTYSQTVSSKSMNEDNIVYLDISPPSSRVVASKLTNSLILNDISYCKPCSGENNNYSNSNYNSNNQKNHRLKSSNEMVQQIIVDLTSDDFS